MKMNFMHSHSELNASPKNYSDTKTSDFCKIKLWNIANLCDLNFQSSVKYIV